MASKKNKATEITDVETDGLDIDLTRSTPPPEVSSEDVAEAAVVAAELDAVMATAPTTQALALPETAPELPEAEGDLPLPPSDADLQALAAADPEGAVVVTPVLASISGVAVGSSKAPKNAAPTAEVEAEASADDADLGTPESHVVDKLARYAAALHMGGTFQMPGSSVFLTVAGDPYLDEAGLVCVMCQKPSSHLGVICVEGLLDAV